MAEERAGELDGMRGIGMILVFAYHIFKRGDYFTTNPVLHFVTSLTLYSWYALSTFYVLSGFLIAAILLRTKGRENYYKNFYVRRFLRVFPLYYFTLALIMLLMPLLDPEYVAQIPRALPFYLFYLNNMFNMGNLLSFMHNIQATPYLGVTWSLAIEEQFYLLFPFLVFYTRKETLAKICGGIIFVSILSRILAAFFWHDVHEMTNFFFYNTFTRFEEISFGILIAIAFTYPEWKTKLSRFSMPVFLVTYIALLGVEIITNTGIPHPAYDNVPLTVVGYTMAALFAAALIVTLTTRAPGSFIRRLFRHPLFVFWGNHSYSIYLFHIPVALILLDVFWKSGYRGWYMYFVYIGACVAITVTISMLTWYLVEMPMLNLKKHFEYAKSSSE